MTKSVASLVDYQEQALACNRRYLDALAVVDDPAPAYPELRQLTEPKVVDGRSYAGFNPARRDDVRLFRAILDGDHITRGFRNGDIREPLFGKTSEADRATACQRGGGASAEASPRPPSGGQDPAHTPLARDGTRQTTTGESRPALLSGLAGTRGIVECYCPGNFSASCVEVQEKESKMR